MNNFRRLLGFLTPYKSEITGVFVMNLFYVFFSLGSITMLIPVLSVIFQTNEEVLQPPVFEGLTQLKPYLENLLNYKITQLKADEGIQTVLIYVCSIGSLFFIFKNIFRYFSTFLMSYINNTVERDIRNSVHEKMLHLDISFFSEKRRGDIMARLTNDLTEIQWAILGTLQRLVTQPLMIIGTIIGLVILSPKLTSFIVILLPITAILITRIGKSLKAPSQQARQQLGKLLSMIEENIGGIRVIKSFTAEDQAQERFENSNQSYYQNMNSLFRRRELASPMSEMIGSMVIIAIIYYAGSLIIDNQGLKPEQFITYIALFSQILQPAKFISLAITDIKRGEAASERVFEILDYPIKIKSDDKSIAKKHFDREIKFENVSFKYEDEWVIKDFSLTIPKGHTVALVGQSGSGKSTITNLITRFYDINEGAIYVDGTNIKDIRLEDLRDLMGLVTQDSILFNETVENNLLVGKTDASQREIQHAADVANASVFVNELPKGYATNIGDGGGKLSGGQRQRLCIARAVLKNSPIMVLDEATSALDTESERLVQQALDNMMQERTSLVVAHRLSTIQKADSIVVMQNGQIAEQGKHNDLLELNGVYSKLIQLQSFD